MKGADYFDEPGDHAGEMETSMMMSLEPELLLPLSGAGAGRGEEFRVAGLREGWAWAPRGVVEGDERHRHGNPAASTPV